MALRGSDEDIRFVIRAIDDGGLRLLAAYQKTLAKIRRDEADFARSGQLRNEKGQFLSRVDSRRVIEAKKLRLDQNAAQADQERHLKREQALIAQSATARLGFEKKIARARRDAAKEEAQRQAGQNTINAGYQNTRLKFVDRLRRAEGLAHTENARFDQRRQASIRRMGVLQSQAITEDIRRTRNQQATAQRMGRLQSQAIAEDVRRSGGRGGLPGGDNPAAFAAEAALWARIRASVIAYYAARTAGRAVTSFVREGIEFNQLIETAILGVASIITASAELRDSQGKAVKGAEALAGAYKLAEDQIQKIRIAGLQTAATTEQLAEAFQQATGPGLAAGLNLDQIRKVTIQIVQAAGAIGVPFNQLNQEVRSILAATIDRNSRIAKTLQITNAQVKAAQEQNRLADFLNEKLQAFSVAGERAATTMFVIKSNLKETLQVFAGTATKTLFEKLKVSLQALLLGTFDFTTLQISDKFQGILSAMQSLFGSIGDLIALGLQSAVRGAAALSSWFKTHKVQVDQIVESFFEMTKALGRIIRDSVLFLARFAGAEAASSEIVVTLNAITGILDFININAGALLTTFIAIKLATIDMVAASIAFFNVVSAHPLIFALTTVAAILTILKADLAAAAVAQERLNRAQRDHALSVANSSTAQVRLIRQYEDLTGQLKTLKEGTDEYEGVQDQIAETTRELIKINPRFNDLLNDERSSRDDVVRAMKEENIQRRVNIELVLKGARAKVDEARANFKAAQSNTFNRIFDFLFDAGLTKEGVEKAGEQLKAAKGFATELQGILDAFDEASTKPPERRLTPFRSPPAGADDKNKGKDLIAKLKEDNRSRLEIIRADIEERKALLEEDIADEIGTREEQRNRAQALVREQRDREIESHTQLRDGLKKIGKLAAEDGRAIDADIFKAAADANKKLTDLRRRTSRERLREGREEAKAQTAAAAQAVLDAQNAIKTANIDVTAQINRGEVSKAEGSAFVAGVIAAERAKVEIALASLKELRAFLVEPLPAGTDQGTLGAFKALGEKVLPGLDKQISNTEVVIGTMTGAMNKANLAANAFQIEIGKILESGITNFFMDIVTQTKSVGEAFRSMALSIVNSIANIIAQTIAWQVVNSILPGAAGPRPALLSSGSTISAATGGFIRGPGTGTSDSVPARLSAGEYVLRADRVKDIGVDVLDAINFGLSRPNVRRRGMGYASGGVVEAAGGGHGGIAAMRIGLERGLILDILRSPEGSKIHVQHAAQNRNKLRQIVR